MSDREKLKAKIFGMLVELTEATDENGGVNTEKTIDSIIDIIEQSRWISVEDRFPSEDGCSFDVLSDGERVPDALFDKDNGSFSEYKADNDGYFIWREIDNITHWQPTPPPPTEDR